jgi:hypothetical protein
MSNHTGGVIYGLCHPATGEIRYVGKTVRPSRRRLQAHLSDARRGSQTHLARWIRSLEKPPQIIVLEQTSSSQVSEAERAWIACLRHYGCRLTNLTDGGEGAPGHRASAETRAKMSAALRGRVHSEEEKAHRTAALRTPDVRAKLSAAQRRRCRTPEVRERVGDFFRGRTQSPEHRAKVAAIVRSPEHRAKLSAILSGRKHDPEWVAKRARRCLPGCTCGRHRQQTELAHGESAAKAPLP